MGHLAGGAALGGAMAVAEIAQLIIDLTIVPELESMIAELQEWQRRELRRQIGRRLQLQKPLIESQLEELEPEMNRIWEAGDTVYVTVTFKALFTDERSSLDRSGTLFGEGSTTPEDPFDLSFHGIEDVNVRIGSEAVESSVSEIAPAMEPSLTTPDLERQRTSGLFGGGEPLLEQTITVAQALEPPEPAAPAPRPVSQVLISCDEMKISFQMSEGWVVYDLDSCTMPTGTFEAGVTVGTEAVEEGGRQVEIPSVYFDIRGLEEATPPAPVEAGAFDFRYIIREGQENPAMFFEGQDTVTIEIVGTLEAHREELRLPPYR